MFNIYAPIIDEIDLFISLSRYLLLVLGVYHFPVLYQKAGCFVEHREFCPLGSVCM